MANNYLAALEMGALGIGDAEYVDALADADDADLADLADLGAAPSSRRRMAQAIARRAAVRNAMPYRRLVPSVPGVPSPGLRLQPMGFPSATFTATSGTNLITRNQPQRPFKGKRLVISVARTGTTATGLVLVESLNIGTDNQFAAVGPVPAEGFAPGAFDTNVELAPATTAINISIALSISAAPTGADSVAVGVALWGEAIGA